MSNSVEKQHIQWLEKQYPGITAEFQRRYIRPILGEAEPTQTTLTSKIMDFANAYTQYKQQREILKAQQARMHQGLPPLNTDQYGMPPIRVQAGVDPKMGMNMALMGVGLLALLAIGFTMRKRGSK